MYVYMLFHYTFQYLELNFSSNINESIEYLMAVKGQIKKLATMIQ